MTRSTRAILICLAAFCLLHEHRSAFAAANGTEAADQDPKYNESLMHERFNTTIDFCKSHTDEPCAQRWLNSFGRVADYFYNILTRFNYAQSNRLSDRRGDKILQLSELVEVWSLRHLKIARRFRWQMFKNESLKRRFMLLTQDMTLEDKADRNELSKLQESMMSTYSRLKACPRANGTKDANATVKCLPAGEQAVSDVLSLNATLNATYDYKLSVWRSWYDAASDQLAANFTRYVELANKGAMARGYADAGYADWRLDFESPTFNSDVLRWQGEIDDLYRQLHAYVRHKLAHRYPGRFDPSGCIPAHILGHDQWAQQWRLPQTDYPHPELANSTVHFTQLLKKRYGNFTQLVRAAEEFYESLGMPAMTQDFWRKSDFFKPKDPGVVKDCHASAWEFASRKDFRIKLCGRVTREDFYVIHHEMGHVEYFMAYSRLPREFRNGANTGFHEAVGDTMALSVDNRVHFAKLGIVKSAAESKGTELNSLFSMALDKISFLPFALTTGVFRWMAFNGTATSASYNRVWWQLRRQFGGVCPPVDRPEAGFDAGAKYHVALDISYIRYYFSFILQFQLHRRMCQLAGQKGPTNRCDFYRSKKAGRMFLQMLQKGSSQPWQPTLHEFTQEHGLQTSAVLQYFRPLHSWLRNYNKRHKVPVGWPTTGDVLKGVSRPVA